ncbi:MAG TPA: hypothetical protein VJT54_16705 [Verrucomicrobiae bacterium]|nr:hypothetical protein [Verrucomicrobiae bacterium]
MARLENQVDYSVPSAELLPVLRAKSQNRPPELGQTGEAPFLHILAFDNHMNQNRFVAFAESGQTAVWPNAC